MKRANILNICFHNTLEIELNIDHYVHHEMRITLRSVLFYCHFNNAHICTLHVRPQWLTTRSSTRHNKTQTSEDYE